MTATILDREIVYSGWLKVARVTLTTASGARVTREVVDRGTAAAVLPYDPERRTALLVRLPRPGALYVGGPAELLEAPAGVIDPGETAAAAAVREALEETGVRLAALEPVARAWPSPGALSETIALYLASYALADRIAPGGGLAVEHEDITVVEMALGDLWTLAEAGDLVDLKTLTLVLALKTRRPELF
jgi:nudix-type nucleoside diphosphatase (YffH/AdpP family)